MREGLNRAPRIWALIHHGDMATIDLGKPCQNGSVESSHSTFRRERLNAKTFAHLHEAQVQIEH